MTQGSGGIDSGLRVREIGEFALISLLQDALPSSTTASAVSLGIGDDAAIWNPGGDQVVITTDALVEHDHFRLDWTDWRSLGHKMLAVNLSDIAAMGAKPALVTVVLGLTGEERVADLVELYRGAGDLAAMHGVVVAGGDIVRSIDGLTLSVTALGTVIPGEAVLRSGAQPGDLVVVSGTIGASAAGMALIARGPDDSATGDLLRVAHLRPNPRVALGAIMHEHGVTAAMDLSDGLLSDMPKIMAASRVSAVINVERLPIIPAVRALFPDKAEAFALSGGEDYELLMTIPPDRFDAFREHAAEIGATLTVVGEVDAPGEDGPILTLRRHGVPVPAEDMTWDHFGNGG